MNFSTDDKNKAKQVFPELDFDEMKFTAETLIASKTRRGADFTLDHVLKLVPEPFTLIDLFGGSGSISLSAALKKIKTVYVESNNKHFNFALFNLKNYEAANEIIFRNEDALAVLSELSTGGNHPKYGKVVLYLDPPWRENYDELDAAAISQLAEACMKICIEKQASFFITLPLEAKIPKAEIVFPSYGRDGIINGKTFGFGIKLTDTEIAAIETFASVKIFDQQNLQGGLSRRTKLLKTNKGDLVISFFPEHYDAAKIISQVKFLRSHCENVITHVTNEAGPEHFELYKYEPGYHANILTEQESKLLATALAQIHLAGLKNGDLRQTLTHGEIYSQNIVFTPDKAILIDWEEIDTRPLVTDIAEAIASFFILNPALAGIEVNLDNIKEFLEHYEQLLPLTKTEKTSLPQYLQTELIERIKIAEKEKKPEAAERIRRFDANNIHL